MELEVLKSEIKKTLESTISTIEPGFNIEEAIDTYLKVLNYELKFPSADDLDSLSSIKLNTLSKVLIEGKLDEESIAQIGQFNQKFEAFIKKLYYILEEFGAIMEESRLNPEKLNAFGPFLKSINKANPYFLDKDNQPTLNMSEAAKDRYGKPTYKKNKGSRELQFERLYPSSLRLDKFSDPNDRGLSAEYQNSFIYHFLRSYILRNNQSHQAPSLNKFEAIPNLQSTLITELWFVDFVKQKLISGMLHSHSEEMDFAEYVDSQIDKIKEQSNKFVPLSLKLYSNSNASSGLTSVNELKSKGDLRLRILGEGGSGKTTTLEYLVYEACKLWKEDPTNKIPVLIFLGNLNENESIQEAIAKKLSLELNASEELIETNSIILFLDGVNEIVKSREEKKKRTREIATIIEENEQLEIIITDRYEFDSYQNDPFKLATYGIQKLNEQQIDQFVYNYTKNSERSSESILELIKTKAKLAELLSKPLLLSCAIEIVKVEDNLPEKEGQIIERFVDLMLIREKNEKMDPLLKVNEFKLLLGFVANRIYEQSKANKSINELKFKKIINEGAEYLGLEKHNAGYTLRMGFELEILSKKDDLLQFYHQSFFEFFVAHFMNYEFV